MERGLLMKFILPEIVQLLKETDDLIDFEEQLKILVDETVASLVGEVFSSLNQVIKKENQNKGWTVERNDKKTVQFMFGAVQYERTLMYNQNKEPHYPLDDFLGIIKHQRYSPLVEVKVAELASENTYRETSRILSEWTAVQMSHTTVGTVLKKVGNAQVEADKEMVRELEESAILPKGKEVDYLFAEADGVFVRGIEKKKHIEVSHGIIYEGWEENGKRVSLKNRKVIMTTQPIHRFWDELQAFSAHEYSLENTRIITNSDGGRGYTAERFQATYSQSRYPVLNQLDAYHVFEALNRALGWKKSEMKEKIRQAIKDQDYDVFTLYLDTYESTLDDDKEIKKIIDFRKYITNHWTRIFDWRNEIKDHPKGARALGGMESNQRRVSFRMKRRGMHWSVEGAEALVKVKQGMVNQTLRGVYLKSQKRSVRKQRAVRKTIHMTKILKEHVRPSIGAKQGKISLYAAHSSAIGRLFKTLQ